MRHLLFHPDPAPLYLGVDDQSAEEAELYAWLAKETGVPLIPFLLEGVAADPELNLPDGIHPNAEGQRIVAATVVEHLLPLLE